MTLYFTTGFDKCEFVGTKEYLIPDLKYYINKNYQDIPIFTQYTKKEILENDSLTEGIYATKEISIYLKKKKIVPGYLWNSNEYSMEKLGKCIIIPKSEKKNESAKAVDNFYKILRNVHHNKDDFHFRLIKLKNLFDIIIENKAIFQERPDLYEACYQKLLEFNKEMSEKYSHFKEIFDPKLFIDNMNENKERIDLINIKSLTLDKPFSI